MAGIYIHIPFCKTKCHYCNFYALASSKYRNGFMDALLREIELRKDYLSQQTIQTIYLGGGTPSMLHTHELGRIFEKIEHHFTLAPDVEITLEANPDDLSMEKLAALYNETPVNRLSMGVQSFHSDDLIYLNRVHDGKQARNSIEMALKQGFTNMTIDLIYGIPTLTEEKWASNLAVFFDYGLSHLSSYALTVEPKTALDVLIGKKKMRGLDEAQSVRHFEMLTEATAQHDFIHYEISNFAKAGYFSKHNSTYWLGGHYAGFGPSAHSFNGHSRQWNVCNMKKYMEGEVAADMMQEKEVLTPDQLYNEYVMTSLRTSWGCNIQHINNVFGEKYSRYFEQHIQAFIESGKVTHENHTYFLSSRGKLFADGIAANLFMD